MFTVTWSSCTGCRVNVRQANVYRNNTVMHNITFVKHNLCEGQFHKLRFHCYSRNVMMPPMSSVEIRFLGMHLDQ